MNISIIGGDLRIVELIKYLRTNEKNKIGLYGLENSCELKDYKHFKHFEKMEDALENSEEIITSIPISKDGETINSPFSNQKIYIKDLCELSKNKKVITGNITDKIRNKMSINNEIIDILKYEELAILNSIPTAEGAIQIAMEKSKITLHDSNCLVMGFGRIGKILAKMLDGIGADVYCEARNSKDLAYIKSYKYTGIDLKDIKNYLHKFNFIFNTIPYLVLDESALNCINKSCLIIDLASKPGGVDFGKANKLGIQVEWCLALPRKSCTKNICKIYL